MAKVKSCDQRGVIKTTPAHACMLEECVSRVSAVKSSLLHGLLQVLAADLSLNRLPQSVVMKGISHLALRLSFVGNMSGLPEVIRYGMFRSAIEE